MVGEGGGGGGGEETSQWSIFHFLLHRNSHTSHKQLVEKFSSALKETFFRTDAMP